ncbi:hypothetical protein GGI07_002721 [Coemansia sp. Benny D115]|nr:hypothetical protein GGI07_002721 [Coemansia sp. Benny D115]
MSPTLRSLWDNRYTQTPPARSPRVQSPLQLDNALVIPAYGSPQQTGLLGSVEDALVTKSALERAARKLAESEALTQQQIICELCERLKSYHSPDDQPETPDLWQGATLLGQFYTLGHGSLAHSSRGLLWSGRMLANVASAMQARLNLTVAGAAEAEEQANLLFPWAKLTAVRRKSIDDDELIMVTVDEDMGVAFLLADMSTAAIDSRVADINAQLAAHLAHERSTPRNTVPHEPQGTAVGSSSADPCENLVRGLLELAAETQQSRLRSADIDRALKSDTFRESAAALTAALSLRLAEMAELAAQTAPVEPVDDDPGTETIPGTCTLCYSATESIELAPCCHRVCTECFARLQTMQKTSPTCAASTTSTNVSQLACPWDRSPVTKWTALG